MSQGALLNTCRKGCSVAWTDETSVRTSAASLKKTILPSGSTVTTPSSRLATICSQEICAGATRFCCFMAFIDDARNRSKIIAEVPCRAHENPPRPGLALVGCGMVKISYTLEVYTRSGLCPLFLFIGSDNQHGCDRRSGVGTGRAAGRE